MNKKIEFDYSRLKGKIVEIFGSQRKFCEEYGISQTNWSLKMNNKVRFKDDEIVELSIFLNLEPDDIPKYFFTLKV